MNKHEERSASTYNKKADSYDDTFDGKFTYKYKIKLLELVHIPENGNLLDIACGNGRFLQMLAQKQTFNGFGCDISENMVEKAKQNNPNITFQLAPYDALPFQNETFDAVTVSVAFHYFPNIYGFAKEVLRVLKPNGTLYIAEVIIPFFYILFLILLFAFYGPGDLKFYAPEEVSKVLRDTGFLNESVIIEGNIQIIQGYK